MFNNRLDLWRKVLYQFHKYKKHEGAFSKAGINEYQLETHIATDSGTCTPDIIGWNNSNPEDKTWIVLELTLNSDESKEEQMKKYSKISLKSLRTLGIQTDMGPELLICRTKKSSVDEEYCTLLFGAMMESEHPELINNVQLRRCIEEKTGKSIEAIPEITFTLLPEFKDSELKRALVDLLMSRFTPKYNEIIPGDLVREGLDYLYTKIDPKEIQILEDRVTKMIYTLSDKLLSQYIMHKNSKFLLTDAGRNAPKSPNTREKIEKILHTWAYGVSLDDFGD